MTIFKKLIEETKSYRGESEKRHNDTRCLNYVHSYHAGRTDAFDLILAKA